MFSALSWFVESSREISAIKPRMSRLLGYIESASRISSASLSVDETLQKVAIEDTGDSGRGGALVQQELRKLAAAAGLTVIGSELLEPLQLDGLLNLRASIDLTGSPRDFDEFLGALNEALPLLIIDSMDVEALRRINRRRRDNDNASQTDFIRATIEVSAYRLNAANG